MSRVRVSMARKADIADQVIRQYRAGVPLADIFVDGALLDAATIRRITKPYSYLRLRSQIDALSTRLAPTIEEQTLKKMVDESTLEEWRRLDNAWPQGPEEMAIQMYEQGDSISSITARTGILQKAVKILIANHVHNKKCG